MSYIRWTCEGSDVYVFEHVGGWFECHGCRLMPDEEHFRTQTRTELRAHLLEHRKAGHCVPDIPFNRLDTELAAGLDDWQDVLEGGSK